MKPSGVDVRRVFDAWKKTRTRPHLVRMTGDRVKLITDRMKVGYTADDLIAVVRYFSESNTREARFMRGENDRQKAYMDLSNLFRKEKLGGRVETALNWLEDLKGSSAPKVDEGSEDLDLGYMGEWA